MGGAHFKGLSDVLNVSPLIAAATLLDVCALQACHWQDWRLHKVQEVLLSSIFGSCHSPFCFTCLRTFRGRLPQAPALEDSGCLKLYWANLMCKVLMGAFECLIIASLDNIKSAV